MIMHPHAKQILALAVRVEEAAAIDFHSGDRERGARLTIDGRQWIADGLRLLASMTVPTTGGAATTMPQPGGLLTTPAAGRATG
jgi:hypothetical protein